MRKLDADERQLLRRQLNEDIAAGAVGLAEAVRRMRQITGLTQPEFAKRVAGISPAALAQIERGKGNPTVATLTKIGRVFGFDVGFVRRRE